MGFDHNDVPPLESVLIFDFSLNFFHEADLSDLLCGLFFMFPIDRPPVDFIAVCFVLAIVDLLLYVVKLICNYN